MEKGCWIYDVQCTICKNIRVKLSQKLIFPKTDQAKPLSYYILTPGLIPGYETNALDFSPDL